jgi:rhomboid family GlyGly-CTERM serine protease
MLKAADHRFPACKGRHLTLPWETLSLAAVAGIVYMALGPAPGNWVFDWVAIADGEIWRLVTGHWVHSDPSHAFWNIAALILMGLLFERRLQSLLLKSLFVGTVAVDAWLWWGDASLAYYCGLSGILNSLLVVGLVRLWQDHPHPLVLLIALVAVAKIASEMIMGRGLVTHTAWPSVPAAHAAGFVGGVALMFFLKVRSALVTRAYS